RQYHDDRGSQQNFMTKLQSHHDTSSPITNRLKRWDAIVLMGLYFFMAIAETLQVRALQGMKPIHWRWIKVTT
ncbi:hypothetical protein QCD79_09540, partial [Pseudomonas quasicaspiana]|nr:hypothetical protein [Pseudomonas quasicaspiana]